MKTFEEIKKMELINKVDDEKVLEIANSIKKNGWCGTPILYTEIGLITGSHRLAALKLLEKEWEDFDCEIECAEDVTDLVNEALIKFEEEEGYIPEIDYSEIGWIFSGTWVEEYKDEIIEW